MRFSLLVLCLLVGSADAAPAATLEVHTQPGVAVYWEGTLLATTDADGVLIVEDVPEGPFNLKLEKPGYDPLVARVQIGRGTTRLTQELVALPTSVEPSETAGETPAPEAAAPTSEPVAPAFRVSTGGWLALLALLGLLAATVWRASRSRQRAPSPPAAPPRVTRERSTGRTFDAEAPGGGKFLSELRQRERAMDDLVDVPRAGADRDQASESDIVDVSWKEVD